MFIFSVFLGFFTIGLCFAMVFLGFSALFFLITSFFASIAAVFLGIIKLVYSCGRKGVDWMGQIFPFLKSKWIKNSIMGIFLCMALYLSSLMISGLFDFYQKHMYCNYKITYSIIE